MLVEEEWKKRQKPEKEEKAGPEKRRKDKSQQKEEKTGARKGRKDRSQQRQRPAVKATFRLTAIIFSF